jgi:hypothetical protein
MSSRISKSLSVTGLIVPFQPLAQCYSSNNVSTAADTGIYLNATDMNIGNIYNTSNGIFTIATTGVYEAKVRISTQASSNTKFIWQSMELSINRSIMFPI